MRVEMLNTGTELLLGAVVNTHLKFAAEELFPIGLRIARQTTVPDGPAIREAMAETFGRAEVLLVTGGLGPTTDDITRELTAELLGLPLVFDEEIMTVIAERFARRGMKMSERVGRQAMRPAEAKVLPNPHGTAVGLYLSPVNMSGVRSPHIFLLPGPPRELRPMMLDYVLPILRMLAPQGGETMRSYRISGLGESQVEEQVGEALLALGIELGYCARPGEVDVRVIGSAAQTVAAEEIIERELGPHIVSQGGASLEQVVVGQLTARGETMATAESCTGGGLADRITDVAGASSVFLAGYVTYSNEAKINAIGVDPALLAAHGAVSQLVANAMAEGALAKSGATYALSTTGIAGPGGGTPEKPVGTVHIALAKRGGETRGGRFKFPTDRGTFKDLVTQTALDLLRRELSA